VGGVAGMKVTANLKRAERSSSQSGVGIVDVGGGVGFWTEEDDLDAEVGGAWGDADDGSRRHLPIAEEGSGLRVEGRNAGEDCEKQEKSFRHGIHRTSPGLRSEMREQGLRLRF